MDNAAVVRQYIEQVINTGNAELVPQFVAENYEEVYNNKRYPIGIAGAQAHVAGVRNTYPDLHLRVDRQIASGEWVATCYTMTGTHSGAWMGIQPTGKIIEVAGVNIDRVIDGKIVEHGGAANLLDSLLAIGAVKIAN